MSAAKRNIFTVHLLVLTLIRRHAGHASMCRDDYFPSTTGGAMHYHDSDDLKLLGQFKQLAPAEFSAFVQLDKTVGREDGAIPRKYRELIAIAVACTTQCPYCLDVHTRAAKRAGATREEVTEAAMLAAALRAGAAVTHGALAVKLFDQA
jgi:AhpD family alkylhydroperoxidase